MKLYKFEQNNSGGSFDCDNNLNVSVYIEAADRFEANRLAEDIGIYFDGVNSNIDCPCCGDRWYEADDYNSISSASEFTEQYNSSLLYTSVYKEQKGVSTIIHTKDNYAHRILLNGIVKSDSKVSKVAPQMVYTNIQEFAQVLFS